MHPVVHGITIGPFIPPPTEENTSRRIGRRNAERMRKVPNVFQTLSDPSKSERKTSHWEVFQNLKKDVSFKPLFQTLSNVFMSSRLMNFRSSSRTSSKPSRFRQTWCRSTPDSFRLRLRFDAPRGQTSVSLGSFFFLGAEGGAKAPRSRMGHVSVTKPR